MWTGCNAVAYLTLRTTKTPLQRGAPSCMIHPVNDPAHDSWRMVMVERPDYQVFGVVTMNDTCSVAGCGNQAVAAFPVRTPQENGVWWLCDRDARAVMSAATGDHPDGMPQELTRTCGLGEDVPCGAFSVQSRHRRYPRRPRRSSPPSDREHLPTARVGVSGTLMPRPKSLRPAVPSRSRLCQPPDGEEGRDRLRETFGPPECERLVGAGASSLQVLIQWHLSKRPPIPGHTGDRQPASEILDLSDR